MPFDLWFSFTLASVAILAIPGPTVLLIVSYVLGQGRRTGLVLVPGVVLGDFAAMTVSLLGAGAVLATSATLFTILKICGAAYLVWLGVKLWRAPVALEPKAGIVTAQSSSFSLLVHAFVVTALNPKGIVFFVAFVPQFVNTGAPTLPQFALLETTFLVLAAFNAAAWCLAAGKLNETLQDSSLRRLVNRVGGSCLCAAGALAATVRQ